MVQYQSYPRTWSAEDATSTADGKTLQTGVPIDVLVYETLPKNVNNFGSGVISANGVPYYGTIQVVLKTASGAATIGGNTTYELLAVDANEVNFVVLKKGLLSSLAGDPTTRNAMNGLPMLVPGATEYATLRFRITPDASANGKVLSIADSTVSIAATINNIVG